MGCPNGELLSAYFDGEVEPPWSEQLARHVAGCDRCREELGRFAALQGLLRRDGEPDYQGARERTLQRLRREPDRPLQPRWAATRATLTVPWPAAAAAVAVVMLMAGFLVYFSARAGYGQLRIRHQPTGVTEVQVAAPIKDLEHLLRSLETASPGQEVVFTLPEDSTFILLGEPRLLREAEFDRSGRW